MQMLAYTPVTASNSTDDSRYRVELLTPAQFHFATSLGGIDFRPEMLTARYVSGPGDTLTLDYSVNGLRGAGRYVGQVDADGQPVLVTYSDGSVEQAQVYESDVKTMIAMLQRVRARASGGWPRAVAMEQYIMVSRRFVVRLALQGGLKDYAPGHNNRNWRNSGFTASSERQCYA
jgi:hypothetical protein